MNKILVTGSAGFIGFHVVDRILRDQNSEIVGIDNINDYYDINLKLARLKFHGIDCSSYLKPYSQIGNHLNSSLLKSSIHKKYRFARLDIADCDSIIELMQAEKFDCVINLAAQAGVRYSIDNPHAYTHSNINGFLNILEGARFTKVKHLIYASTSSVYGLNATMPLSEIQITDKPMALYAATKKANELFAHSYSHLFGIPTTGLRFFTVYGPWGRPDMALYLFAEAILNGASINVFNHGDMVRDFTFVEDVAEVINRLILKPPARNSDNVPFEIFNVGNSAPIKLSTYITELEKCLGKKAIKNYLDIQAGDVLETHADTTRIANYIKYRPNTEVAIGIKKFVDWFLSYKNNK
jgi:UDP-glucuronate 4-epimerase